MAWRLRSRLRADALLLCFGVNENFLSHLVLPDAPRLAIGPGTRPETVLRSLPRGCQLVLPALNLTEPWRLLPEVDRLAELLGRRGVLLVNVAVRDQGKRALQSCLAALGLPRSAAAPTGDAEELLLVKSELNSGALAERLLRTEDRNRLGLEVPPPQVPTRDDYRLLSRRDVPVAWFDDPWLHIERFIGRGDGISFRLLQCGSRGALMVRHSPLPVARSQHATLIDLILLEAEGAGWQAERWVDPAMPGVLASAWQVAESRGLQFGAFDIVVDRDSRPYVVDLNLTPHQSAERYNVKLNAYLRAGLPAG